MKAVICTEYGEASVLKVMAFETPNLKSNDVLIKVKTSTVSAVDSAFRKGDPFMSRLFTGIRKPKYTIPGDIIAGEIVSVGPLVKKFKVGDAIFGHTGSEFGGHGEYIALDESEAIIVKPKEMSFEEAAAFSYSAMTALPFVRDHMKLEKGSRVLINGASGAIGTFAVQMALNHGAIVTAVCGPNNIDLMKALGAQHVIDYTKEDFANTKNKYEVIFDVVGKRSFTTTKHVLDNKGIYLTTIPNMTDIIAMLLTKNKPKQSKFVATGLRKSNEKISDLLTLKEMFLKREVEAVIDRVFSLDKIVEAHEYVDKGHNKGNVILKLGD